MTLPRLTLLLAVLIALLVMAADYLDLRRFEVRSDTVSMPAAPGFHPLNTYTARPAARQAAQVWGTDPDSAIHRIEQATTHYPLDARPWLDLARIDASLQGEFSPTLAANLEAAVAVQPRNRAIRWRAAQIALHAGDRDLTEFHLRRWLDGAPGDVAQALFIVRRWIDDPDQLIERMLPSGSAYGQEYLAATMDFAHRQRDSELAEAAWRRVAADQTLESPLFLTYVDFLLDQGQIDRAVSLWAELDRHYRPGDVANGDFSRELGEGRALNWRVGRLPDGMRIARDFDNHYYQPASLMLEFKGTHNLGLRAPAIRIPVQPGQRYELSGYWQGEALTTRALPYIFVQALGGRMSARAEPPRDNFTWTRWAVEFETPETTRLLNLMVRRDPTNAFDRYIGGRLWLDGIRLRPIPTMDPDRDPAVDSPLAADGAGT